ncbi:MAG: hypothetical protein V9G13_13820, partial [Marmoricola sp.]
KEARWGQPVNGHVVDLGNGQKGLQAVLPHFSDYGFAPPPPPVPVPPVPPNPPNPPDSPDNPNCPTGDSPCGSLVNFISGGLSQEIATQALPTAGGLPTQITARYRSLNMAATATFDTAFTGSSSADQYRTSTLWDFQVAGRTFVGSGKAVSVAWDKRDANGQLAAARRDRRRAGRGVALLLFVDRVRVSRTTGVPGRAVSLHVYPFDRVVGRGPPRRSVTLRPGLV